MRALTNIVGASSKARNRDDPPPVKSMLLISVVNC